MMQAALEAIAHPGRRVLLALVAQRELPVGELARRAGMKQPAASQHLRLLREAGLMQVGVAGKQRLYRVDDGGLARLR